MPDDISTRATDDTSPETESGVELAHLRVELEQTREALASSERQLLELRAERSATMGRLERQAYWLERGRVDLDTWMQKRALYAAFRLFSALLRGWNRVARRLR